MSALPRISSVHKLELVFSPSHASVTGGRRLVLVRGGIGVEDTHITKSFNFWLYTYAFGKPADFKFPREKVLRLAELRWHH